MLFPALQTFQQDGFILPVSLAYLTRLRFTARLKRRFDTLISMEAEASPCSTGIYTTRIGKMENDLETPPSNIFPIKILLFSLSALHKVYIPTLFIYCFP